MLRQTDRETQIAADQTTYTVNIHTYMHALLKYQQKLQWLLSYTRPLG